MYGLIIFDCDGVLIDSEILSCDALIASLAEHDIHIDRQFVFAHCIGHSFPTVLEEISRLSGRRLPKRLELTYRSTLLKSFEKDLMPIAGVEEMLAALAIPYCIATSSGQERAERSLMAAGLSGLGAPIFTASMVSHGKPAPDLFLHAARSTGVAPGKCLVVEDSMPGILAARAAGMAVLRFTGGSHFKAGFGQGEPSLADAELDSWKDFAALIQHHSSTVA